MWLGKRKATPNKNQGTLNVRTLKAREKCCKRLTYRPVAVGAHQFPQRRSFLNLKLHDRVVLSQHLQVDMFRFGILRKSKAIVRNQNRNTNGKKQHNTAVRLTFVVMNVTRSGLTFFSSPISLEYPRRFFSPCFLPTGRFFGRFVKWLLFTNAGRVESACRSTCNGRLRKRSGRSPTGKYCACQNAMADRRLPGRLFRIRRALSLGDFLGRNFRGERKNITSKSFIPLPLCNWGNELNNFVQIKYFSHGA